MTEDEQQAKEEERRFLSAQPVEVQAADALTRELQTAFTANNPKRLADALASAVKAQVWKTGVVFYPSIPSRRKVVKYDSIYEWADAIHIDLDELVTLLAQRHDHVELVAPAVEAFFLEAVKDREKFFEYSQDRSESKPGWRKRIQMLVDYAAEWASTFALFESISTNSKGRPTKADPLQGRGSEKPHAVGHLSSDLPAKRQPNSRLGRVTRTLQRLKGNPKACADQNTTPERVQRAYTALVEDGVTSAEKLRSIAGLRPTQAPRVNISGNVDEIAKKVIKLAGPETARTIANSILSHLS